MKNTLVLVLLVLFLMGCASCNKADKQNINTDIIKRVYKQPVQPGLSPGTVLIEATILTFEKNKNSLYLIVDKVLGTGHSTPDLSVGEKIIVNVHNKKFNHQIGNNDSLTSAGKILDQLRLKLKIALHQTRDNQEKIGRASCRERV